MKKSLILTLVLAMVMATFAPAMAGDADLVKTTGTSTQTEFIATTTAEPYATSSNGKAAATLSGDMGDELIYQSTKYKSIAVQVKPQITAADITRMTLAIPARTLLDMGDSLPTGLTVITPVGQLYLPKNSMYEIGFDHTGNVSFILEKAENAVKVTISAANEEILETAEGIVLTVPYEGATMATVAMADGVPSPKSVALDGTMYIPLKGTASVEIMENAVNFTDIPNAQWARDAIDFASSHKLFNGTSATEFSPNGTMTKGMLLRVLHNMEGNPRHKNPNVVFADLPDNHWAKDAILWAHKQGIMTDALAEADKNITRENLALMIWRYAGKPATDHELDAFADADSVSDEALTAFKWCNEKGIINGKDGARLAPNDTATRTEVAAMLMRLVKTFAE